MTQRFATYPSLNAKVVVVTGGATGIGKAFVEHFCEQKARVHFLDLDATSGDAAARSTGATFWQCDVTDTAQLQTVIREIGAQNGRIDVLIANAANDSRHAPDDLTSDVWDECVSVNLKHQFFAAQAAWPIMAANGGGSIICLGSISWLNNTTGMIAYTSAKAGVHGLMRTLARQLGPCGIRVNALLPGWTMTERQTTLWVDTAAEKEITAAQCLPGKVMPSDVARMALFLAADDSAMCTQQSFVVDGGWI